MWWVFSLGFVLFSDYIAFFWCKVGWPATRKDVAFRWVLLTRESDAGRGFGMFWKPPYLGGVLMALTLCRKKNSIGCQDHGFFSTNCQPTCHFSTNCQSNLCLQYASGSRTTSFKKYKKTLCREIFFAPFFSTMCLFFSSMRCPGFFRFFKKKTTFLPVVVADTL